MKSKSSPKRNRRTKRQQSSLRFDPLEPRQMLTFFTPGPSDSALFDNVVTVTAGDLIVDDLGSPFTRDSRNPTQINLTDGGRIGIDGFESTGRDQLRIYQSELNVTGGNIGDDLEIALTEINVSGGVIGNDIDVESATLNFSGGVIGEGLRILQPFQDRGTEANISGGTIGELQAFDGLTSISGGTIGILRGLSRSNIDISGGVIGSGDSSFSFSGETLNISGGEFRDPLFVSGNGEVNLFVLEYELEGISQDSQAIGETITVTERDITISGVFSDGTSFSFPLNISSNFSEGAFRESATLNVTLVDETGIPNEPAVISGDLTASIFSDGYNPEVSGQLNVSDSDPGSRDRFLIQRLSEGEFGQFKLAESGSWTYFADREAIGALLITESISDSFDVVADDGTIETVTITINGVELPPPSQDSTISGDLSGSGLATDNAITGVVSVTDPDVGLIQVLDSGSGDQLPSSQTVSTDFFSGQRFEISSRTRIDEVGAFFQVERILTEESVLENNFEVTVFAAINRLTSIDDLPDNPDLTGNDLIFRTDFSPVLGSQVTLIPSTGLILEPGFYSLSFGLDASGTASVLLPNFETSEGPAQPFTFRQSDGELISQTSTPRFIINGEVDPPNVSEVIPQSGATGEFGTFTIDAIGNWNYVIDTAAVETLVLGESESENFQIVSIDGTASETITVTVNGVNQAVIANDTALSVAEDAVDGATVGTVLASDPDGDAPSISIVSGNEAGVFAVDAAGNVTVADASQLDFDATSEFVLVFEASDGLTTAAATLTISVTEVAPPVEDFLILGTSEDDTLVGNAGDNVLVGLVGSDILIGSAGNDVFITDEINGDNNNDDRDVIRLGNVDVDNTGNDVVTDFDVNGTNGGENNFDTLEFTFNGIDFSISTRNDIRRFVRFIERDGDVRTDAILDGNDLILVFGRDSDDPSIITSSVRLEDVVGQNGLTQGRLRRDSVDLIGTAELDLFFAGGAVEVGSTAGESLVGGVANDVIVGGAGSDILFGGAGNDTLTGDQTNGGRFGRDQDTFAISTIAPGSIGNDVITDFDVNNLNGGERNFDTLTLSLGGDDFSLSTGQQFLDFANLLDNNGNDDSGTLIDGDDIIFVFGRNSLGFITDSVRLKDVIGDDGLTNAALAAFDRVGESGRLDVFTV